jgi:hypothetical protein
LAVRGVKTGTSQKQFQNECRTTKPKLSLRSFGYGSARKPRIFTFLPLDAVLRPTGITVIQTPPQSPMSNAYAERFVRETRETLDQPILFGEGHLRHVLKKIASSTFSVE